LGSRKKGKAGNSETIFDLTHVVEELERVSDAEFAWDEAELGEPERGCPEEEEGAQVLDAPGLLPPAARAVFRHLIEGNRSHLKQDLHESEQCAPALLPRTAVSFPLHIYYEPITILIIYETSDPSTHTWLNFIFLFTHLFRPRKISSAYIDANKSRLL
jgi:hypothetical protein